MLSDRQIVAGTILLLAVVGIASAAVSTTTITNNDDGIILNQPNGPTANLTGNTELKNTSGGVDSDTIQFNTTDGSARFTAPGDASVTIAVSELEGTWTNGTDISAASNNLTINPGDKEPITVGGDIDHISYRSMTVDDQTVDFSYGGSSGYSIVIVRGLPANTQIGAVDDRGAVLDTATTDGSGTAAFNLTNSDHDVRLLTNTGSPSATNIDPSNNYETNQEDVTFNLTVDDPDFPDDNVTATLYENGPNDASFSQLYQTEIGTSGEVSTTQSLTIGGDHEYYWVLEDAYGESTQTNTRTASVPDTLFIYDINDPDTVLTTTGSVEVTFSANDQVIERSTSNGEVSLEGLPVDGTITASVSATDYIDSQTVFRSIFEQQGIYLLPDTTSTYQTRFVLEDNTGGRFEENNPTIDVERALNKSGQTQWVSVRGGRFGVQGFTTQLEQGEEYRLIVRNDRGDSRIFYPFTASAAETVPLEVGSINATTVGEEGYTVDVFYDTTTTSNYVELELYDPTDSTETVWVEIYERGNQSNVLLQNTSFTGPYGNLSVREQVPQQHNTSTWVVEYAIERDSSSAQGQEIVGPRSQVLTQIPWWLRTIMSVGVIWITAGLFSKLNGAVGGLVCAGLGGLFWYVGFLPSGVGVGVVVLAMITAGMLFVRSGGVGP